MPTNTDLVTDLPADFEVFGQAVDTSMADLKGGTTGQILSKATNADMDFTWIANDQGDITGVTATSPLTGGGTSGAITVGIQDASTSQKGSVQLSDSTSTTSSVLAATATAVKSSYDLAAAAIPKSTVTTAGDVIYATGSSAVTRVAIGSAGQILTVASGIPSWASPSAGGMTLISTTTLTGSSVSISVPSGYNDITYIIRDAVAATTSGNYLYTTFNSNTSANYNYVELKGTDPSTAGISMTTGSQFYAPYVNNGSDNNMFLQNTIYDYLNTSTNKSFNAVWNTRNNSAVRVVGNVTGTFFPTTPAAITSIQFAWDVGNHSSGTVLLYGVK